MPKTKHPLPPRNQIWLARKKIGLQRKEVAFLLSHHRIDSISRFERGHRLPSFKAALELEIILGLPVSLLFPEQHQQLLQKILQKAAANPALQGKLRVTTQPYCHFWELLHKEPRTEDEQTAIDKHVVRILHRRVGIEE